MKKFFNYNCQFFTRNIFFLLLFSLSLTGCQKYNPKPLPNDINNSKLQFPIKKINEFAKNIKHLNLKSVELNLTDGLSPNEAAIIAVYENPSLKTERANLLISNAEVLEAGLIPNPQFTMSLDKPNGGLSAGTNTASSFGLGIDLEPLITHSSLTKKAKEENKKIVLSVAWKEMQIAELTKITVYQIVALNNQLSLLEELKEISSKLLKIGKEALRSEVVSENLITDFNLSNLEINKEIESFKSNLVKKNILLNKLMGVSSEIPIKLQKNIQINVDSPDVDLNKIIKGISNRRLDLLAFKHAYLSLEEDLRIAVLNQFPKINLGLNTAKDNSNLKTIGIGISIDLPIFNHSGAKIKKAKATRQKLFEEYNERIIEAKSNIIETNNLINYYKNNYLITNKSINILKQKSSKELKALKLNSISITTYLNTKMQLLQKEIQLIEEAKTINNLTITLSFLSGYYDINNLKFQNKI